MRDDQRANEHIPARQVRAHFDAGTIRVYQAYPPEIAEAALRAGTFVAPFRRERMTWIKPSFRWMAYRCGWAEKPGQTRVLGIDLTREGFHWALRHAVPSQHGAVPDRSHRRGEPGEPAVRVQWDPERDLCFRPLAHRSLQLGLRGEAVERYLGEWITGITDLTATMTELGRLVRAGDLDRAAAVLPAERVYPLPAPVAGTAGTTAASGTG